MAPAPGATMKSFFGTHYHKLNETTAVTQCKAL